MNFRKYKKSTTTIENLLKRDDTCKSIITCNRKNIPCAAKLCPFNFVAWFAKISGVPCVEKLWHISRCLALQSKAWKAGQVRFFSFWQLHFLSLHSITSIARNRLNVCMRWSHGEWRSIKFDLFCLWSLMIIIPTVVFPPIIHVLLKFTCNRFVSLLINVQLMNMIRK